MKKTKKIISILITLSLAVGASTIALAEGNDATTATQVTTSTKNEKLTLEQKQAKDAYLKVHLNDKNQLLLLRQQTKDAMEANKAVYKQIKDKIREKTKLNTKEKGANKELKNNVKDQLKQVKAMQETIKTQQQEKKQLWNTYKENIKNKDYTAAEAIFKSIIEKKTSILENIKQKSAILNKVLASLN
ncbi:hypothetical protein [Clostridium sp. JNZ J1-5]